MADLKSGGKWVPAENTDSAGIGVYRLVSYNRHRTESQYAIAFWNGAEWHEVYTGRELYFVEAWADIRPYRSPENKKT